MSDASQKAPEGQYIDLDLGAIRKSAERQREDAETISVLLQGIDALVRDKKAMAERIAALEAEVARLTKAPQEARPGPQAGE